MLHPTNEIPFIDDSILFSQIHDETPSILRQLVQLSPVLQSLGMPSFPEEDETIPEFLSSAFNIVHAFLRFQQQETRVRDKYEEEIHKLKADIEALQRKNSRLNDDQQIKERQLGQQENTLTLKIREMKTQIEKLSNEKDEVQRNTFKLQQKISQMSVELRKKDNEIAKIKDQFKRVDKHQVFRNAFDISEKLLVPKKNETISQSGWEGWVEVRHKLIEENYRQKEVLENITNLLQSFFREIAEAMNLNGLFDELNCSRIQLLKGCDPVLEQVKEQLSVTKKIICELNGGNKLNLASLKIQKQQQVLKICKENKSCSFKFQQSKKLNLSVLKPSNEAIENEDDAALSLISRISLNDVPEAEAEELSGNKSRVDLKKWDLIFKS